MKKLSLLFMSLALMFVSCKDFLNMPPKNVKVVYSMEDVRETMSTYLFAITNSSYGEGASYPILFNGAFIQFPFTRYVNVVATLLTNDLDLSYFLDPEYTWESNSSGEAFASYYAGCKEWNSEKLASRVWSEVFNNVGYLNMTLKDLENAPDFNQEIYDRVSGEARVARAYYLLTLNSLFAPMDRDDLGIPFNFDADIIQGGARWSQKELYKKLIGEIKDVMEYKTVPKDTWNIFYNRRIMCAILAQAYLYKAGTVAAEEDDWANAELYAREARNEERMANTVDEISELVKVPYNKVVNKPHRFALLRIGLSATDTIDREAPWGTLELGLYQSPSEEFYSMFDDNDLRKDVYFLESYDGTINVVKLALSFIRHNINDSHVLFSFAELQLIEAEALVRQGNGKGLELLNDFKKSRIPGYAGYTGNDVIGEIFKERRKEFAYEGLSNWIDLKRLGEKITRSIYDENDSKVINVTLNKNDYRYTFPIPSDIELQYNNILQNPGWK